MRRLFFVVLIFTIANVIFAQVDSGLYQFEDYSVFSYSGTGWSQLVDGDYIVMRSTDLNDSVSMDFTGSSIIIYRELRTSNGVMEVCIDTTCTNVSNHSSTALKMIPVAFVNPSGGTATLTITNVSGGSIWLLLDYVIVMPVDGTSTGSGSELQTIYAPEPSTYYLSLESGRVVAIDFSITGGEIANAILLSFLCSIMVFQIVFNRWNHD